MPLKTFYPASALCALQIYNSFLTRKQLYSQTTSLLKFFFNVLLYFRQELKYAWSCETTGYPVFCEVHAVLYMAGQYTSPTLVLGFTVERYIAICHPFRKERYCTATVAVRVSACMIVLCLALASAQVSDVVQTHRYK